MYKTIIYCDKSKESKICILPTHITTNHTRMSENLNCILLYTLEDLLCGDILKLLN